MCYVEQLQFTVSSAYHCQLHVLLDWIEATINTTKSTADGILFDHGDTKNEKDNTILENVKTTLQLQATLLYLLLHQEPNRKFRIEAMPGSSSNTYRIIYPAESDVYVRPTVSFFL